MDAEDQAFFCRSPSACRIVIRLTLKPRVISARDGIGSCAEQVPSRLRARRMSLICVYSGTGDIWLMLPFGLDSASIIGRPANQDCA